MSLIPLLKTISRHTVFNRHSISLKKDGFSHPFYEVNYLRTAK
ncbi:hypothetical protein ACINWCA157_2176 [Acinetobacter radioresistens WC-A-157]|nr:hypothetical protein ACINWCA157_2176 [Acinetobacter radioresistens WC-A-157]